MHGNRPVYDIQSTFRRSDGQKVHLSANAAPLRDGAGSITGAVISLRDITDQVAAGAELEAMDRARSHLIDRLVSAQEEERRRIAADMHDDSLQVMAAISLRLARVRGLTPHATTREAMDELQSTVELAATRLRHLLFNLRPPVLDREGVAAALREYLEQLRGDAGVRYRVHDRLAVQPSPVQRIHLFRIAQEALSNVRKHAAATRVDVSLDRRSSGTLLTVRDDGQGFDLEAGRRPDSLGLLAMAERAEMMGGWCEVHSAEGEGTRVRAWLPDEAQQKSA
jgi:signal transduction histidine kinase